MSFRMLFHFIFWFALFNIFSTFLDQFDFPLIISEAKYQLVSLTYHKSNIINFW